MTLVRPCIVYCNSMRMASTVICIKCFSVSNTFIVTNIRVSTVTCLSVYTVVMLTCPIRRRGMIMRWHFLNG